MCANRQRVAVYDVRACPLCPNGAPRTQRTVLQHCPYGALPSPQLYTASMGVWCLWRGYDTLPCAPAYNSPPEGPEAQGNSACNTCCTTQYCCVARKQARPSWLMPTSAASHSASPRPKKCQQPSGQACVQQLPPLYTSHRCLRLLPFPPTSRSPKHFCGTASAHSLSNPYLYHETAARTPDYSSRRISPPSTSSHPPK